MGTDHGKKQGIGILAAITSFIISGKWIRNWTVIGNGVECVKKF